MAPSSEVVVGRKIGFFAVKTVKWLKQISYSGSRLRTADCWTLSGNTTYVKMSLAIVKFVLVVNKVGKVMKAYIMIMFLKVKAVWVKIFRSYVICWSFLILLFFKKMHPLFVAFNESTSFGQKMHQSMFSFRVGGAGRTCTLGDLTFYPFFKSNSLPRGQMLVSNTPPWGWMYDFYS